MIVDRELKLHLTKKLVNFAVRVLNRFTPSVEASYPQTIMVKDVFIKLQKAYLTEVYAGRFDGVAHQNLAGLKDKHFWRLLQLSEKLLVYLGEEDRYYRQWLGLAFLLMRSQVEKALEGLTFEDFLALSWQQWLLDYHGAVSPEYFHSHKEDMLGIVFTDFLVNLV